MTFLVRRHVAPARDVFRRFWPYTRGTRLLLLAGGLSAIVVSVSEITVVAIFAVMTNKVLERGYLAGFWSLAAWWLAVATTAAAVMGAGGYLSGLAAERFILRLRGHVFAHIQRLAPDFVSRHRLGDLVVRLTDDIELVEAFVSSGAVTVLTSAISLVLFAGALLVIRWDLALVTFAVVPLFWLISRGFSSRFTAAAERERAVNAAVTSVVEENLSNHALVQAFGREEAEAGRLRGEATRWLGARMTQTRLNSVYSPLIFLIETLAALAVLAVGAWDIAQHRVSLGGLLAFAAFTAYLYPPARNLSGLAVTVAEAAASGQRITEIMQTRPAVTDGPDLRARLRSRGRIDVDAVTFRYPGAEAATLAGLSFTACPGSVVAIVGPSGAGKSTVARLLLRMYDPCQGSILLDGVDIRRMSLHTLRHNITLLDQENLLFPGSIRDNIAYGGSSVTEAQIMAAAEAAGAEEFITRLPQGYDTLMGQRGRLLSGGQRQRIAIARALVRNAPILVLDEPSTGLDKASAEAIRDLLISPAPERTTIVITHDPRFAAEADSVVVLGDRAPVLHP
jgi:ATP-binding cassette subfamily B protein